RCKGDPPASDARPQRLFLKTRYGGFFHTSVASPRRLSYDNRRPSTAH
ncbi:hypothetical protein AZ020_000678, partial [Enterobacter hormaechei]